MLNVVNLLSYSLFISALGYYFITTAQWYSYKLNRVIFHHTKAHWNILFFLIPFVAYEVLNVINLIYIQYIIVVLYLIALYAWYKKLDKPLVITSRVKRFFIFLALYTLISFFIVKVNVIFAPILLAWFTSVILEKILFQGYVQKAIEKLDKKDNLIIVGVTASYGKTSMKNFITKVLSKKYNVYSTPRSVNTLGGIVKDINEDLPADAEVYVIEMGARERHDIYDITKVVNPHYAVVGSIGPAHIEYFKSLENIRNTKMDIIKSNRLKEAWVHISSYAKSNNPKVKLFGHEINNIKSSLNGLCFNLDDNRYCANILGKFNAINLAAAIKVARALNIETEDIHNALSSLESVEHRLQKIEAGGKVIIDDSFNGNIDGVLDSYELVQTYDGRKVIITPGLVEVDKELNEKIAKKANEIFDLIVVTGELNYSIFKEHIESEKLMHLEDKSTMEKFLIEHTKSGDLILFSNDAPSFI